MGLNVWSLSEVELLQFLAHNLCGYDLGLEAGSRKAIKSNLVIYLVPYPLVEILWTLIDNVWIMDFGRDRDRELLKQFCLVPLATTALLFHFHTAFKHM